MKIRYILLAVLALAWAPQTAAAQEQEATQEATQQAAKDSLGILQAIGLPTLSAILRERGVPETEVAQMILGSREKGIPADETAVILGETAKAVEESGPIENFGAFVQTQLEAGLRGRELAEAIRSEHARRGIGKGNRLAPRGRGQGQGQGQGQGPPGAGRGQGQGQGQGQGRPDAAGQGQQGGPDTADTARRGPPDGLGRRVRPTDSVPDSTPRRRGGGNGGEG